MCVRQADRQADTHRDRLVSAASLGTGPLVLALVLAEPAQEEEGMTRHAHTRVQHLLQVPAGGGAGEAGGRQAARS